MNYSKKPLLTDLQKKELLNKRAKQLENRVEKKRKHTAPEVKPSKSYFRNMKLKKIGTFLLTTLAAENRAGKWLHGALDMSFIPNQAIAKRASMALHPEKREVEKAKLTDERNIVAGVIFVFIIILIVMEKLSIVDAVALLKGLAGFI